MVSVALVPLSTEMHSLLPVLAIASSLARENE